MRLPRIAGHSFLVGVQFSMRLLSFMKLATLVIALTAVTFVAGVSVYLRIEQYWFRRTSRATLVRPA